MSTGLKGGSQLPSPELDVLSVRNQDHLYISEIMLLITENPGPLPSRSHIREIRAEYGTMTPIRIQFLPVRTLFEACLFNLH